jgi:glycosyltransferase involved in cell wall biosynthesis
MRLAYYSPLPPQRSGIADYSAELLPALARRCEIVLITDDGKVGDAKLAASFPVEPEARLPELLRTGACDLALYQLGNNPDYHGGIYRRLRRTPGVVVLHEYVLHHLIRELTLSAGDGAGYVEALRYSYGTTGEILGRRSVERHIPLDPFRYPLFEPAADAARALIVHNRTTAERVRTSRPEARIAIVPHHLSLTGVPTTSAEQARARLAIAPQDFVVATFGFVTPAKRAPVLLRAFARLRSELPAERAARARLLLVGEVSPSYNLDAEWPAELRPGVTVVGRLPLDRFLLHMVACDVAVNLRHPSGGETSGTLVRLLGLGKPVLATDTGSFAEIPDGCCAKVDLDEHEEDLLVAYLRALEGDADLRARLGANARHWMASRTVEASAAGYLEVLERCLAEGWQPAPCPPPLAPWPASDLDSEIVRDVSRELCDLGAGERSPALARVAEAMAELGIGGAR